MPQARDANAVAFSGYTHIERTNGDLKLVEYTVSAADGIARIYLDGIGVVQNMKPGAVELIRDLVRLLNEASDVAAQPARSSVFRILPPILENDPS